MLAIIPTLAPKHEGLESVQHVNWGHGLGGYALVIRRA
jgi:hypothetical protein